MSETYFTSDEIETLKDLELNGVTLRKSLDDLITKRISVDREICSSHDLKKGSMNKKKIKEAGFFNKLKF